MVRKTISLFVILALSALLYAQDTNEEPAKTGWNFGVLPALGYDSNLGLLYGAIVNMFDYGDGSRYPDYDHNLYLQLSAYTKGSMDGILFFDSYSLIPNKHFIGRFSYNRNRTYPFHGFNGVETVYSPDFETDISQVFYKLDRELVKADFLVEDKIADTKFNWIAGLDLGWYNISTVDIDHLNHDRDGEDVLPDENLLYDNLVDWGIIGSEVKDGGFDNSLKFGLVYNSRDRLTNPMSGIWTELLFRASPNFLGNPSNFGRLSLIHRQYFTIVEEKLSFAYRLWYEGTFGDVPFYSRQHLTTSNYFEGFGGAQTVRGLLMNRVVGQHTAIGNFELRWKAFRFKGIGQNFYLGFNAFADAGSVLKGYDMDLSSIPEPMRQTHFNESSNDLFTTFGAGLKLVMNENFVVSADYGLAMDESYGTAGLYVLVGYLF
ncbi:MAG: Omp85 family outer membrane protein [Bacteroidales bacterium]